MNKIKNEIFLLMSVLGVIIITIIIFLDYSSKIQRNQYNNNEGKYILLSLNKRNNDIQIIRVSSEKKCLNIISSLKEKDNYLTYKCLNIYNLFEIKQPLLNQIN